MVTKIIHMDMDCFFAAVEIRDNPQLKNKPVAVGGGAQQRGVLCTCNYLARTHGLRSAMPTAQALARCPDLVLLPVQMEKYRRISQEILTILRRYTSDIEPLSLDEAYLDVSLSSRCHGRASLLARKIRADIYRETGLTASAGISINKFLAKVASDWNKPNGQLVIPPKVIHSFVKTLPVNKIPGVGQVTAGKLQQWGINTCGQLQTLPRDTLTERLGKFGQRLYDYSRGIDHRRVQSTRVRKSVSVEHTFPQDLTHRQQYQQSLVPLYERLCQRLERYHRRTIHKQFVKVKFADFSLTTRECMASTLSLEAFQVLLKGIVSQDLRPIRLLGLGVRFNENATHQRQKNLF